MAFMYKADLHGGLQRNTVNIRANALPAWGGRCALHRKRAGQILAVQDKEVKSQPQAPAAAPAKSKEQQQQQPNHQAVSTPTVLQQVQQQWDRLDWKQRGYAVVLGLVVIGVLPQLLALVILLLERVLVAGLLAFEEALVALLFKGGVALGVLALVGLAAAGVYLFASKATK